MASPTSDLFGTYLKTVRKSAPAQEASRDVEAAAEREILHLLKVASEAGKSVSQFELIDQISLAPTALLKVMAQLQESKLVDVAKDEDATVSLTPFGEKIAS